MVEKLAEVFEQTRKAASAIAVLRPDNTVAQEHVSKASEAAASGDHHEARRHLQAVRVAAEAAAEEARRLAHEASAAAARQMLQAAQAVAAEAELALTELDYLEAARLFGEAASLVPNGESSEKGALLERQADALQRQGDERGDNTALRQAIRVYGRVLELLTRERVPLDWAMTQNNLGNALSSARGAGERDGAAGGGGRGLSRGAGGKDARARAARLGDDAEQPRHRALRRSGERESGTARLEEAVAAYRAALEEWTRERVPLDWAMTQNNLGNALCDAWASGRAGRRGWRRRSPPIARRWRNGRASACRSTGR